MRTASVGICALCKEEKGLKLSHITPAFVVRWLKASGATPHLRSPTNPNLPLQDITKVRLLCGDCEELFSKSEKEFAEKIFIPYHEQEVRTFKYDKWLLHFAVSLVWRAAVKESESLHRDHSEKAKHIDAAVKVWGDFLLGRIGSTGRFAHHLFFWDPRLTTLKMPKGAKVPDKFFWYVMRDVDSVTVYSKKSSALYAHAKLPHMFFWSGIRPTNPDGFKGTLIKSKGTIAHSQSVKNSDFELFIRGRVREVREHMSGMSDKQRDKIEKEMLADPEKSINSK